MRIAHLPFGYYPEPEGGTEVYVRLLAAEQQRIGHETIVIAPAAQAAEYDHEGVPVFRYAVSDDFADIVELYSSDTSVDAAHFEKILRRSAPDVLHVHGYGRAVTKRMLRTARQLGVRIIFTYHTPTATCVRGTLMRWGDTVCDGALIVKRCTACMLNAGGVPRTLAQLASGLPVLPAKLLKKGSLATGLRMRELVGLRHEEIREFLAHVDHIIAPAEWVKMLLERNGVPASKITLNRQGTIDASVARVARLPHAPLKLAFFGRLDPTKGLHVIIDALALLPDIRLELHVYAVTQVADSYGRALLARARLDSRVVWHDPVPQPQVLELLGRYDLLVVPSQWLETGPLVVLEAFAAGVPVLGSRLGGIAELVRDGINGVLVEPAAARGWAAAIRQLAADPDLLSRLQTGVPRPRTMSDVARALESVYAAVMVAA